MQSASAFAVLLVVLAWLHVLPLVVGDATSPECRAEMAKCAAGQPCADLILDGPRAQRSAYVTTETFTADSCAVLEGCTKPGTRKLLRFDMATANVGTQNLPIGNPGAPSLQPCFIWSSCHNHFHFSAFGEYTLRSAGNIVAVGAKAAACVQDAFRWPGSTAPIVPTSQWFGCSNQGITIGYQDVYGAHLDCQWVDVTGVAAGTYTLELNVNVARVLAESNYDNNLVSFPVVIPADAGTVPPPSTDPTGCSTQGGCQSCTSAAGGNCGWCSSAGYCAYGSYLGPSAGTCREWTWGNGQCTSTDPIPVCAAQTSCQSCAATTGCGWCPNSNTCSAGTATGPSVGTCPQLWQFGASNSCGKCDSLTRCDDCASATGCGWCASSNRCSGGTWQGPSGATCANWVWSASICASLPPYTPPSTASSCTGSALTRSGQTAVGTCPSGTNTLASGSSCQLACNSGYTATAGGTATCNNGVWTATQPTCTANTPSSCVMPSAPVGTNGGCPAAGSALASGSSCTYTVASGWTLQSGSLTRSCSNGVLGGTAPVLVQAPAACSASGITLTASQASIGTCPTGTDTLASGSSCQLACASGYTRSSGGLASCNNGAWTMTQPVCLSNTPTSCTLPNPAPAGTNGGCTTGGTLASGSSCTYTVLSGWTLQSGSLTRTCSSGVSATAAPVLSQSSTGTSTCSTKSSCLSCAAATGCGWCPNTNKCTAGTATGPSSGTCPQLWQFGASNSCGKCESMSNCGDCAGATGCGWCGSSSKCFGGTWLGPAGTTCASSSWIWSASTCTAPPVSAAAVCSPATDCTSCSNLRSCGWCPATNACAAGVWTGPSVGTCPTWVWSAPNCQAAAAARAENLALTAEGVTRMSRIGSSPAAVISRSAAPSGLEGLGVASSDSSAVSFSLFPADQMSLLSSLRPGVDPERFLTTAELSLDELLKADPAGNALKQQSPLSVGLKNDPAGNFLKLRPDIDLSRVQRPADNVGADGVSRSAADGIPDVRPAPVANAWDPDPSNPLLPHGHYEHHQHIMVQDPAAGPAAGTDGSVAQAGVGGATPTAAAHIATSLLLSILMLFVVFFARI